MTPLILANILQPLSTSPNSVIVFFHDTVGLGWGLVDRLPDLHERLLILPLSIKQIKSMRAMQALQPQMKEIQEKYKDDKQRQQQEMMEFYQENEINPLASCFPLLLQLPVFLALYQMLNGDSFINEVNASVASGRAARASSSSTRIIEKPTGTELHRPDRRSSSAPSSPPAWRWRAASRARSATSSSACPSCSRPFIFTHPAGLAVYWISTNIWTFGQQQFVVKRIAPPPDLKKTAPRRRSRRPKPPPPPPRKKKKRK